MWRGRSGTGVAGGGRATRTYARTRRGAGAVGPERVSRAWDGSGTVAAPARVAQTAEQLTRNEQVRSSILLSGSTRSRRPTGSTSPSSASSRPAVVWRRRSRLSSVMHGGTTTPRATVERAAVTDPIVAVVGSAAARRSFGSAAELAHFVDRATRAVSASSTRPALIGDRRLPPWTSGAGGGVGRVRRRDIRRGRGPNDMADRRQHLRSTTNGRAPTAGRPRPPWRIVAVVPPSRPGRPSRRPAPWPPSWR